MGRRLAQAQRSPEDLGEDEGPADSAGIHQIAPEILGTEKLVGPSQAVGGAWGRNDRSRRAARFAGIGQRRRLSPARFFHRGLATRLGPTHIFELFA
jgi:hypothetical protein